MLRARELAVALIAAVSGCGAGLERADPAPAPPAPPVERPARVSLRDHLIRHAVHHGDVARRELYTWTRPDQIAQLRRERRLLIRDRGAQGQIAAFDFRLQRRRGDPIAALLASDGMKYRRFAWVSPWPIRRGWGERDYGDRLIRITLADEAVIGMLDSHLGDDWRFVDLTGREVSIESVLAAPHRLGAVYHVWHLDDGADLGGEPHAFREYVLCNEAMIARWEVDSEAVVARLEREREVLRQLADAFRRHAIAAPDGLSSWARRVDEERWPRPPDPDDLRALYESNLALLGRPYLPSASNVAAVEEALSLSKTAGPPLVVMRQPTTR